MRWLALDTATDRASVALGSAAEDALEESLVGARRHAGALLPMIDRLLARSGMRLDEVAGVALSDGPGSFTGLRVGATVAKALARAHALEVRVAPSLLVRAIQHAAAGATVLAVANALRGELYAAAYRFTGDRIETLIRASVWRPEQLMTDAPRPDRLVGDGPPDIMARLGEWSGLEPIEGAAGLPCARDLLDLLHRPGGARSIPNLDLWEPDYGRPAEAQARWERAHGRPLPDPIRSTG